MRLQKYLASCRVASRRKCEELIAQGRVTVDGVTASLGTQVEGNEIIKLDGKIVEQSTVKLYFLFHKPYGVITSVSDPQGRLVVTDFFPESPRLFPVGRLDWDTSGLLIMTNDGELAYRLTHPRYGVVKTYRARLDDEMTTEALKKLKAGAELDGRHVRPDFVKAAGKKEVIIGVHDGRNREVRRLIEAAGRRAVTLVREGMCGLMLGGLEPGQYRALTKEEVEAIKRSVGIRD